LLEGRGRARWSPASRSCSASPALPFLALDAASHRQVTDSVVCGHGSRHTSTPASIPSARAELDLGVDSAGYPVPGALARGIGTNCRGGGKLPSGNFTVSFPALSASAASRNEVTNSRKPSRNRARASFEAQW
jgi:hypothetical protein